MGEQCENSGAGSEVVNWPGLLQQRAESEQSGQAEREQRAGATKAGGTWHALLRAQLLPMHPMHVPGFRARSLKKSEIEKNR
jgi:hypothetical protein